MEEAVYIERTYFSQLLKPPLGINLRKKKLYKNELEINIGIDNNVSQKIEIYLLRSLIHQL
jgi:hypothetical protein